MRRVTLYQEINKEGSFLIPIRAPRPFTPGDTIELISPDGTFKVVYTKQPDVIQCDDCVFDDCRYLCPRFKNGGLLCMNSSTGICSVYIFRRLSDVMEEL